MEKIERIFKPRPGDEFQMTGLDGNIKSIKIIDVSKNCAWVIVGDCQKATLPIDVFNYLDRK